MPIHTLDLTLPTPEENLACDEALLDDCEENSGPEILRFWESPQTFVVLGYSNKIDSEVYRHFCEENQIPVLRRTSGGGTVVQGPGCLNFSLLLRIPETGPLTHLLKTTHYILERNRKALEQVAAKKLSSQGISDLTVGDLKFSGNAQRRKQKALLFHGSFLLNFDLSRIEKTLRMPMRQPSYRKERSHKSFVTNLAVPSSKIKEALQNEWNAEKVLEKFPEERIKKLVEEKYSKKEWNEKF